MIVGDVTLERIFEICDDVSRENVIKLLLRCKKMYEARVDIKKILLEIIKKEDLFNIRNGVIDCVNKNLESIKLYKTDEEKL
jgi:hypothetical protein